MVVGAVGAVEAVENKKAVIVLMNMVLWWKLESVAVF